ncbi:chemotaxis protein CheW [Oceanicoccus sagamiensis]|uniref:CheW-like domain-containing protein n=1 Tax=Oceanicoccus sagamiensis TaxID=716816 RepID=A0A1X9NE14_9GAMM|nr:chemotaxis protein CheW [Oceanicoccus sagamiensis]ARN74662.1 hypothetical protein BST96_11325 [Oceanicoccus sagamiensis]
MNDSIPADNLSQYLTFCLHDELLGLNLHWVKEVIEVKTITALPRAPQYVRGVINLRGQVIPVIDLRIKFSIVAKPLTVDSCIIIVESQVNEETVVIGVMVDSVSDVLTVEADDKEPAPGMGGGIEHQFIEGLARLGDHFITLLDSKVVFSLEEMLVGSPSQSVDACAARPAQPVDKVQAAC